MDCKCGCGDKVNINVNTRPNRIPKYIKGHNARGRKCPWKEGVISKGIFKEGEKHPLWNKNPSYQALHTWVRSHKIKPDNCEKCNKRTSRLDAANISGKYKRDINDYKYICKSCHNILDKRVNNLRRSKK